MAVSYNDKFLLSQDSGFRNRIQESLVAACVAIGNEGWAIAFHRERAEYANTILNGPASYVALFANASATDTNCINDATQGGTVALTAGNTAAQAALVTDAHIDTAIAAEFNAFVKEPGV